MRIRAFQGLRPTPENAKKVASPPYDVINTAEARELAAGNPLSFLHVIRPDIDLPDGTDMYSDAVYSTAAENLQKLQQNGALVREDKSALYVYQQNMSGHIQRGVVALCHSQDYLDNKIKKHEKTRPDKENDRTRITSELSANAGPVFLTYEDSADITALVDAATKEPPLFDFTAPDGIQHTVWPIADAAGVTGAFEAVSDFYVADGHHRSASAARVGAERAAANPNHTGDEDYNWFLTVLFPAGELKILPYNRVLLSNNGHSVDEILSLIKEASDGFTEDTGSEPAGMGDVRVYVDGKWHTLKLNPAADANPVTRLDCDMLQQRILTPVFGIEDPRTSKEIAFAGGIRGTDYLKAEVDEGRGVAAFSLYPVSVKQLMDIADADQVMPPKSTWFEPKLRSGLFVHTF
ncbi:DUF1015 domain-containing protein [Planctomycetota bacterium]|nr:DUF1015 domain-containing protein [Planctomycetota bacterium]